MINEWVALVAEGAADAGSASEGEHGPHACRNAWRTAVTHLSAAALARKTEHGFTTPRGLRGHLAAVQRRAADVPALGLWLESHSTKAGEGEWGIKFGPHVEPPADLCPTAGRLDLRGGWVVLAGCFAGSEAARDVLGELFEPGTPVLASDAFTTADEYAAGLIREIERFMADPDVEIAWTQGGADDLGRWATFRV